MSSPSGQFEGECSACRLHKWVREFGDYGVLCETCSVGLGPAAELFGAWESVEHPDDSDHSASAKPDEQQDEHLKSALEAANKGLRLAPEDPTLLALKKRIQEQQ